MKKMINTTSSLLLILLTISLSQVHAQENEKVHSPEEGSRALQFQINNNFNLSSFSGSFFSYKRHISENRAHRISLSLQNSIQNRSLPDSPNEEENSFFNNYISASFTWMNYLNPENDIKFYYGYGPGIDFGYQASEDDDINSTATQTNLIWGISGYGYSGVEWFVHPSISLHAEYRASVRAGFSTTENKVENKQTGTENTNKVKQNTFSLGGNGVRFGLSVYF
jgi:hypothetical protein